MTFVPMHVLYSGSRVHFCGRLGILNMSEAYVQLAAEVEILLVGRHSWNSTIR